MAVAQQLLGQVFEADLSNQWQSGHFRLDVGYAIHDFLQKLFLEITMPPKREMVPPVGCAMKKIGWAI